MKYLLPDMTTTPLRTFSPVHNATWVTLNQHRTALETIWNIKNHKAMVSCPVRPQQNKIWKLWQSRRHTKYTSARFQRTSWILTKIKHKRHEMPAWLSCPISKLTCASSSHSLKKVPKIDWDVFVQKYGFNSLQQILVQDQYLKPHTLDALFC